MNKNLKEERNTSKLHQERYTSLEQKLKAAKNKIRDVDTTKHEYENKLDVIKSTQK